MKRARYWKKTDSGIVCALCPHHCSIKDGGAGRCGVRRAREGELFAEGYGLVSSANLDPMEKKPLYHFYPGSQIFSVGGWGCNLACAFCQNWQISQHFVRESRAATPETVVKQALAVRSVGIAYTYNEPLVGIEFVMDCASLAREQGLRNVLVTNGYVCAQPAGDLLPLIDAANVDIKSMNEDFYAKHCRAELQPVLDFCRRAISAGCHLEVTNLIIPGLNDDDSAIEALAEWVGENLGKTVPVHLSGYHPDYKMNVSATPASALERAFKICGKYLPYVYVGNVRSQAGQNTYCPGCGALLVKRMFYDVEVVGFTGALCSKCGKKADFRGIESR